MATYILIAGAHTAAPSAPRGETLLYLSQRVAGDTLYFYLSTAAEDAGGADV